MTKVVVPLDGSAMSEKALVATGRFAELMHADVVLVGVLDQRDPIPDHSEFLRNLEAYLLKARQKVEPNAKVLAIVGKTSVQGILQAIEREGADLVIMSAHGRSCPPEQAMGSVARDLVRTSPVPVMLVGPCSTQAKAGADAAAPHTAD